MPISIVSVLCVGAGGGVGAILRYLLGSLPCFTTNNFPIMTCIINIIGSFVIGLLMGCSLSNHSSLDPRVMLALKVGVCGGFTTFSTFSLETYTLIEQGHYLTAGGYAVLSVLLCVVGTACGMRCGVCL